jgi:hypothetical protein
MVIEQQHKETTFDSEFSITSPVDDSSDREHYATLAYFPRDYPFLPWQPRALYAWH